MGGLWALPILFGPPLAAARSGAQTEGLAMTEVATTAVEEVVAQQSQVAAEATTYERQRDQPTKVDPEGAFWRRHVRIGVTLFEVGGFGVLAYAAATPGGRYRPAMIAIDAVAMVVWITVIRTVGLKLVATRWREQFFFCWSTLTAMFIGTAAALDGGTHSPLSYLLVVPILFGGLAYRPKLVVWLVVVAVGVAAGTAFASPDRSASAISILVLSVAIAGMLTIGGAMNRERLNERLIDLAALDSLTGCLAYRAFHDRLDEEFRRADRYGRPFGLLMVDVDNLKKLNDSLGHQAGDEALVRISAALRKAARASDVVGRLGGDEFALLLPETDEQQMPSVLERLCATLESPQDPLPTTLSFGSTTWRGPTDFTEDMLGRADEALYAAKHAGRNRSVAWEPSIVRREPVEA